MGKHIESFIFVVTDLLGSVASSFSI